MSVVLRAAVLAGGLALALEATADEGMWMASQLPDLAPALRAAGFQADAAALADLTRPPLNAVVKAGGATGAFVSANGLLLTNHHVAYGAIQYNARADRNLLETGFVAADQAAELPAGPDFRVLVTVGFDRVTDEVLKAAQGKKGRAYFDAVEAANKTIVAACEREPGMRCSVATMDYGAEFFRIRQLELRDVRLVYAPPSAAGKYGDEIDNFVWPRHSADFTLLRAYVAPDGSVADFAPENRPYQPPAHLQITHDGPKDGDFVMLAGYPGITYRHRLSYEVTERVDWGLPTSVELLTGLIRVIETRSAGNAEAAVRYASLLASLKNASKRFSGEREGLLRGDAKQLRETAEQTFLAWLATSRQPAAIKRDIDQVGRLLRDASATRERDLILGLLTRHIQLFNAAITLQRRALEHDKPDARRESGYQQRDETLLLAQMKQVQRRYEPGMEQALLLSLLARYQALPKEQRVAEFDAAFGSTGPEAEKALAAIYGTTRLGDEETRLAYFNGPADALRQSNDALLVLAAQLQPALLRLEHERKQREGELLRLRPSYMRALKAWYAQSQRALYPDANGTLRVSYGRVTGFRPRDGVEYTPVTTVAGIVEKHSGKVPFDAPAALLAAIAKGDFGATADPTLKTQTVNFLSNLDSTGGNSGSPVLNARGELVGLNFDSNWESVSASWQYDPRYKRAIHVDMRYLRWLMEKVWPAPHLLREMRLPADG
ncbi:S46 family peptidase [Tahibacter amnicola]|uniref:Dipeptidyl-peptidase n=1 Tax=Tahibacter amnicola TaxID=2976241 RepID=A0ABY6BCG5_9GAMM|nr:S46 family peptidase [Tahibacter amnicola]UXI67237.1 S46 family peptidase [Tahibacter amnicola]